MIFKIYLLTLFLLMSTGLFAKEAEAVFIFKTNLDVSVKKTFKLKGKDAFLNNQPFAIGALALNRFSVERVLMIKPDGGSQCSAGSYVHQVKIGKNKKKVARGCLTSKNYSELVKAFDQLEKAYKEP